MISLADINLSSPQLTKIAQTLSKVQLQQLLLRNYFFKHKKASKKKRNDEQFLNKLNRKQLITEIVTAAQSDKKTLKYLCEIALITPQHAYELLKEEKINTPDRLIKKLTQFLSKRYKTPDLQASVPVLVVLALFSIDLEKIIDLIEKTESQYGRKFKKLDILSLITEYHQQNELSNLLEGIGSPKSITFCADEFQLQAVDLVLNQDTDVLVSAPTGSGKTWIAEQAIRKILERGESIWYTSPLKALSNDKFQEFSQIFGAKNVGIITGDRRINPEAPLKVATTEIYRNSLYDAMNELVFHERAKMRLVIFDEVHYIGDTERGVVWEESIIYTPPAARILMLSATVGNAQELTNWVSWARNCQCNLVLHLDRSVPLRTAFIHTNGRLQPFFRETSVEQKPQIHPDIQEIYDNAFKELPQKRHLM